MTYEWTLYACLCLALWSAVVGGTFAAFSEFVMSGLLRAAPAGGIESMQQINRTVIKTQFCCRYHIDRPIIAFPRDLRPDGKSMGVARQALLLAPIVYLPTVFLMTLFGNVPMNNRLERLAPDAPEAEAYWRKYGRDWTRLNHVRTLGSVVTAGIYLTASVALISSGQV